jgi:hypothetical protein
VSVSKARRAELEAELLKTMDRQDALKVELREALADHRVQMKLHATKLKELRDILSGREAEQAVIPGCETGEVKPKRAAPKKNAPGQTLADPVATRRRSNKFDGAGLDALCLRCCRPAGEHAGARCPPKKAAPASAGRVVYPGTARGEITRWIADARARKVPTFVVEQTGIRTKAGIIAKWGENAVFEKGKPTPRPPEKAKAKPEPEPKFEATAPRHISWTEGDGTLQVVAGTTTYRVQEITPTRWVLESKSERERSWHKEAVLESLNACESEVMKRHPATTFAEVCLHCGIPADQPSEGCTECQHGDPLDDLVGSREDAVKRHKEVAGG